MKVFLYATTMMSAFVLEGVGRAQQADAAQAQPPATAERQQPAVVTDQEPAAAATAGQQPGDSALQDIVVTAQRRSENLQDVPIVVSSVSGDRLKDSGISNLAQISTLVPGLTLRQAAGSVQTSIRGVGSSINGGENTAAIYIDDVYLPLQRDGLRELPDVEQIAVLKGPQGTLFGRNATAGVIQITTREPTKDLTVTADATVGNYETVRFNGFVSGGLSENIRASLSAQYEEQGKGYGRNLITGGGASQLLHSFAIRGKLLFEPTDQTSITLAGDYLDRDANLHALHPTPGTSFVLPLGPLGSRRDYYSNVNSNFKLESGGGSLKIEHELDFATVKSVSAYRQSTARNIFDALPQGIPAFYVEFPRSPANSFSQELQLNSSPGSAFRWSAGAFYFRARDANRPQNLIFFPSLIPGSTDPSVPSLTIETFGRERTESVAGYAQADIDLTPRTTLTLGGRFTYEKRRVRGQTNLQLFGGVTVPGEEVAQSTTANKPTWRVALNHEFDDDVMVYASYNRGFKSGGFNIASPAAPAYEPEQLDAYEVGIKSELFDRRLRLNIGGFYYDYNNIQVTQFIDGGNLISNGAKARLYGVDVDLLARLTSKLTLSGGLSIVDNKFVEYLNALGATPNAFPPGGTTQAAFDASGNRLPGAQKYTANLLADYVTDASFGKLNFNVTANYNGKLFFEPDNFIRQDDYVMLNASVRLTSLDGRYSLTAWGRNLTNELIVTGGATLSFASLVAYEAPPRIYGVTAGFRF
ncbi:TonB-dependent receptor [uncultured Sphingomonas sp.]|uniref:TonB-dependent receptor n=1 Tax=uncultured Sphingomonas sp. TaxID=158754 RepID=UPI0035CA35D3